MSDRRCCLVINMTRDLQTKIGEMSVKYKVSNPKNSDRTAPNVAEMIRMILYYQMKRNKIKCATFIDIPPALKELLDKRCPESFEGKHEVDVSNKIQVRTTEEYHAAVADLAEKLGRPYSDIARSTAVALCSDSKEARHE